MDKSLEHMVGEEGKGTDYLKSYRGCSGRPLRAINERKRRERREESKWDQTGDKEMEVKTREEVACVLSAIN